jgi:hypothetical protein
MKHEPEEDAVRVPETRPCGSLLVPPRFPPAPPGAPGDPGGAGAPAPWAQGLLARLAQFWRRLWKRPEASPDGLARIRAQIGE